MGKLLWNRIQIAAFICVVIYIATIHLRMAKLERDRENAIDQKEYYKQQSINIQKTFQDDQDMWHNAANVLFMNNRSLLQMKNEKDPRIEQLFKEFKSIKNNNVQSFSTTTTHNETRFNVKVKDTVIYNDTSKIIKYKDKFLSLDVTIKHDSVASGKVEYIDNIDGVIYKKQKKLLFIPLEKPQYTSELVSKNPNTQITMNSVIIVRDKNKKGRH